MAWNLRNNIDLVQINLDNNTMSFFIPENVDFRDKKINNVMLLGGADDFANSPFDGRTLVNQDELKDFYVTLVSDDKQNLFRNVNGALLSPQSNVKFDINSVISLKLSSLQYFGGNDLSGKCVLFYVSYDGGTTDEQLPTNSVSVNITIPAGTKHVKLSDYIDNYIRRQNKKIKAIETHCTAHYYLLLQERGGRVFRYVPSNLFVADYNTDGRSQPLMIGDYDVEFQNSYIYPQENERKINIILTFYY